MKKIVFALLLFMPMIASAQVHSLINRIDDETGARIQTLIGTDRYPLLIQSTLGNGKSFTINFPTTSVQILSGTTTPLIGTITVKTITPVQINFRRTHLYLPSGWATSVCFGSSCYATTTDSLPSGYTFTPGVDGSFTLDFDCPKTATRSDSIIDYITLTAEDGDPSDTISFMLKGVYVPQAGVTESQQLNVGPKITSVYPSPLVQGSAIKVRVSSPRETNLSYTIYDGVGRVVGLGTTRQHISLGDNTISINSLDGLSSGSYMLKLNFGDGSSDTHFFQVLK